VRWADDAVEIDFECVGHTVIPGDSFAGSSRRALSIEATGKEQ
jgi:hypothetical protein